MRIVVGGYIIGYPLGGMTWHHLNYLLGLHEMGHQVCFLEDSGEHNVPYNPSIQQCQVDSAYGRAYVQRTFDEFELKIPWCYYSQLEDQHFGLTRDELHETLARADLMICVSGVTPMRDHRPRPRRTLVIDTDPVFTQLRLISDRPLLDYYRSFDAVATFGRLIGTPHCPLPTHGIHWIATNQPVALRRWPVMPARSRLFTTIGKWEHTARAVELRGRRILSSKGVEWMKVLDLPSRTSWRLSPALTKVPDDIRRQFEHAGWILTDPEASTIDCAAFRSFVQSSAGEFTVVKQIYNAVPSGWFSDRSACYLASGRPVVSQSGGFDRWLPTGQGLFSYDTVDEAAAALETIAADYGRHTLAARRLAEEFFDATKVLRELLERVM